MDGGTEVLEYPDTKLKIITKPDPPIWTWSEHAKNLNIGLKEATGETRNTSRQTKEYGMRLSGTPEEARAVMEEIRRRRQQKGLLHDFTA